MPTKEINQMTAHIPQNAIAKIPPPIPIEVARLPVTLIGNRSGAGPNHSSQRNQSGGDWRSNSGDPIGLIVRLHHTCLAHRANSSTLNQLDHPPVIIVSMNLCAHLGSNT